MNTLTRLKRLAGLQPRPSCTSFPGRIGLLLGLALVMTVLGAPRAEATHIVAGYLRYEPLPGNLKYRFELHLYRDCEGIAAPSDPVIDIESSCGNALTKSLTQSGFVPDDSIAKVCPGQQTTCDNTSSPFLGVQEYIYSGVVTLPQTCSEWTFSYQSCCRNYAITNINNPGNQDQYIQATLDNTNGPNESPVFRNQAVPYICQGNTESIDNGALDNDGDSLAYEIITPKTGAAPGDTVVYNSGFRKDSALSSGQPIQFNDTTGVFRVTPSNPEVTVMAFRVKEYNSNGQLIGTTVRDLQVVVIPSAQCTQNPELSGVNGNFGNSSVTVVNACPGETINLNIDSQDPNNDNITLSPTIPVNNATTNLQNQGTPNAEVDITWTPTPAQGRAAPYIFTVQAEDDACPLQGSALKTYIVNVKPAFSGDISIADTCQGETTQFSVTATGNFAAPIQSYSWSGPGGLSGTGSATSHTYPQPNAYPATVTMTDANGCKALARDTVRIQREPIVSFSPPQISVCSGGAKQVTASAQPPASNFSWSPTSGVSNPNSATTTISAGGNPPGTQTYTVTATASNGCQADTTYPVQISPTPPANVCNTIYVTNTASPSGRGSKNDPAPLRKAIELSRCNGSFIKMACGTYTIDSAITRITNNVTLEGGYEPGNNWTKTNSCNTVIRRSKDSANALKGPGSHNHLMAFRLNTVDGFRLQDLTIDTEDLDTTNSGVGATAYGLYLRNCSNYAINRCAISSGAGAQGSGGAAARAVFSGSDTLSSTAGFAGGAGGAGGDDGTTGGDDGDPGDPGNGPSGGAGGSGGDGQGLIGPQEEKGSDGLPGGDGSQGAQGANGSSPSFTGGLMLPGDQGAQGANGQPGSGGGGGGGGGGDLGSGGDGGDGGDGGAGGRGGVGGFGGSGGGGSFGVFIWNNGSGGQFQDCSYDAGPAGAGGQGGEGTLGEDGEAGNPGQPGGDDGASGPKGDGGDGGSGGAGGQGGDGGDGQPGAASPFYIDSSPLPTLSVFGTPIGGLGSGQNDPTDYTLTGETPQIRVGTASCTNTNITFESVPGNSVSWQFLGGGTPATANGANVSAQYGSTGPKNIGGDATRFTSFYTIQSSPSNSVPDVVLSNDTLCPGDSLNYATSGSFAATNFTWEIVNESTGNVMTTITGPNQDSLRQVKVAQLSGYTGPGNYIFRLAIQSDCCGLTSPGRDTLTIATPPSLTTDPDQQVCAGDTLTIGATATDPADLLIWNNGVAADSVTFPVQRDTSVSVFVQDPVSGCASAPDTIQVDTSFTPVAAATPASATVCPENNASFTVAPAAAADYTWRRLGASTDTTVTAQSFAIPGNQADFYTVTAQSAAGCQGPADTVEVAIKNPSPKQIQANRTSLCAGDTTLIFNANANPSTKYYILPSGTNINDTTNASLVLAEGTGSISYVSGPYAGNVDSTFYLFQRPASGCVDTEPDSIIVNAAAGPDFDFTGLTNDTIASCGPDVTLQINTSLSAFEVPSWQRDGDSLHYINGAQHTTDTSGTYVLTVTNTTPASTCDHTDTAEVVVHDSPVIAGPANPCAGDTYTYTSDSTGDWQFSTPNPAASFISSAVNTNSVQVQIDTAAANGTFELELANKAASFLSCTANFSVNFNGQPLFDFVNTLPGSGGAIDTVKGCSNVTLDEDLGNQSLNYTWSGPSGFSSTDTSVTVNTTGEYDLTITDPASGCSYQDTVYAAITTIPTLQSGPASVCADTQHTYTTDKNADWSVTSGPATIVGSGTNTSSVTVSYPATGSNYSVTLEYSLPGDPSCANSTTISVSSVPFFDFVNTVPGGGSAIDTVKGCTDVTIDEDLGNQSLNYNWSGPSGFSNTTDTSVTVNTSGAYDLTITDPGSGCSYSDTVYAEITTIPSLQSGPTTVCAGTQQTYTADKQADWFLPLGGARFVGDSTNTNQVTLRFPDSTSASTVRLKYTLPADTSCADSSQITVDPIPAFTIQNITHPGTGGALDSIFACDTAALMPDTGGTSLNYSWTSSTSFSSNDSDVAVTTRGEYYLVITDPATSCADSDSVYAFPSTTPQLTSGDTVLCAGRQAAYTSDSTVDWTLQQGGASFAGGSSATNQVTLAFPRVSANDTVIVQLEDVNTPNCAQLDTIRANGLPLFDFVGITNPGSAGAIDTIQSCDSVQLKPDTLDPALNAAWGGPGGFTSSADSQRIQSNGGGTANGAGSYDLILTNASTGCSDSDTVYALPSVTPQLSGPTTVCAGDTFNYSANKPVDWQLISGNASFVGDSTASSQLAIAIPLADTTDSVVVQLQEPDSAGCSIRDTISVNGVPTFDFEGITHPVPNAVDTIKACDTVLMRPNRQSSSLAYDWQGPGGFSSSDTVEAVTQRGDYQLIITDPTTSCADTDSVFADVSVTPQIVSGPSSACALDSVTLETDSICDWFIIGQNTRFSNGNVAEASVREVTFYAPDSLDAIVIRYQTHVEPFCRTTDTLPVNDLPRFPDTTYQYCSGDTLRIDAATEIIDSMQTYSWSDGTSGPQFSTTAEDSFQLTVTGPEGCEYTGDVLADTLVRPRVTIQDTAVCYDRRAVLMASPVSGSFPNATYLWRNAAGDTLPATSDTLVIDQLQQNRDYRVELVAGQCTSRADTGQAAILSTPRAGARSQPPLPATLESGNTQVQLQDSSRFYNGLPSAEPTPAADSLAYSWAMASLDTLSGEQVQYTFPDEGGTYEITYRVAAYTGEQVCRDTTTAGEVEILDIEVIRVPNVFTPNGDGINDQLRVRTQGIESMTVIIYDRWGNQVASGDYQPSGQQRVAVWDGNLANGGEAAAGAYFYVIDAETAKGLQVDRSGNVSLMR